MDIIEGLRSYRVGTDLVSWHPAICDEAAAAITDLLARAEAAEARRKLAEKCFDDSALHACETQLELERKARAEAEDRAERAEKERDECKARYCAKEPCATRIHYEVNDCEGDCLSCATDCPCNKCEDYSMWSWNGRKEEQA